MFQCLCLGLRHDWMLVVDLVCQPLSSWVGVVSWLFLEAVKMALELQAPILST